MLYFTCSFINCLTFFNTLKNKQVLVSFAVTVSFPRSPYDLVSRVSEIELQIHLEKQAWVNSFKHYVLKREVKQIKCVKIIQ